MFNVAVDGESKDRQLDAEVLVLDESFGQSLLDDERVFVTRLHHNNCKVAYNHVVGALPDSLKSKIDNFD
jgi:hypothetical protein